jgi:regulatory protein
MNVKITKIEIQKRCKTRYSVYSEDKFLFGVSQDTLLKFNLYAGKNLTKNELNLIQQTESGQKLRDQALRFLSRRAHSCKELRDKLLNKGYPPDAIESLIRDFTDRGYLNDREFARAFIEDEINIKYSGPVRIKDKLNKRGIAPDIAGNLISELYSVDLQMENCRYLAEKKFKNGISGSDIKMKQALISFLRGKGFTWEHISAAIPYIIEENDSE